MRVVRLRSERWVTWMVGEAEEGEGLGEGAAAVRDLALGECAGAGERPSRSAVMLVGWSIVGRSWWRGGGVAAMGCVMVAGIWLVAGLWIVAIELMYFPLRCARYGQGGFRLASGSDMVALSCL